MVKKDYLRKVKSGKMHKSCLSILQDEPGFGDIDYSRRENSIITGIEVVVQDDKIYKSDYSTHDFMSWPIRVGYLVVLLSP